MNIDAFLKDAPDTWRPSVSNKLGRLTNGIRNIKGNQLMKFVLKLDVTKNKKVTYANMVYNYHPNKVNPFCTGLTVGGDGLNFFSNSSSPAASLIETKLLLNSTISDAN